MQTDPPTPLAVSQPDPAADPLPGKISQPKDLPPVDHPVVQQLLEAMRQCQRQQLARAWRAAQGENPSRPAEPGVQ